MSAMANIDSRRELAACAALVRHAWQARANQGGNWLTWTLLALVVGIPMLAFALSTKLAPSIGFGAGIPLTLLILLWWPLLLASLARQNLGTAHLVPAIARRSVAVILCGAVLISVCLTLLCVMAGGAPLLTAVVVVLALAIVTVWICVPKLGWGLLALVMLPMLLGDRLTSMLPFGLTKMLLAASPVLSAFLWYVAFVAIYRGGGQMRKAAGMPEMMKGAAFARQLARDCAEGRIEALLMHAVGTAWRPPTLRFFALVLAGGIVVVYAAPGWTDKYRHVLRTVIPLVMVALQVSIVPAMVRAVYAARREQALVRLAPRAPDAQAFKVSLVHSLLLEYGRCWLGSTVLALVLLYCLGAPPAGLMRVLAVFLMTLAWANLLLRDYVSERGGPGSASGYVLAVLAICGVMLVATADFFGPGAWLAAGAAVLAAGLALASQRWNAMLR